MLRTQGLTSACLDSVVIGLVWEPIAKSFIED